MKHSDILTIIENAISSPDISIIDISRINTHSVDQDDYEVVPGKRLSAGDYGVVELKVILPIK